MSRITRRSFLAALGLGGAGAVAGAAVRQAAQPESAPSAQATRKANAYRVTEHVRRYYRTARV